MTLRLSTLPYVLGSGLLACVLAATALQVLSGTPLWSEYGPLSIAQAFFLGVLALPCGVLAIQPAQRPQARAFWGLSGLGLALVCCIELVYLTIQALPEPAAFDFPAASAWAAAATALLLIERLELTLGRSRSVLRGAFLLHSVAFLADFADGGMLSLTTIHLGLLGSADEVLELLCLGGYILGVTLFALDMTAGTLWRPFDTEPRPLSQVLAATCNPSRAYAEAWVQRPAPDRCEGGSAALFLHAAYRATRWSGRPVETLKQASQVAVWPLITVTLSALATWRKGGAVRRDHGVPIARQVLEQVMLALSLSISPRNYYVFELYLSERRARARDYLQRFETKRGIYRFLKKHRYPGAGRSPLTDKADFVDHCRERGLPVIPYILLLGTGVVERAGLAECESLPARDLFVKPNKGRGGGGAEKWRWLGGGCYQGSDGVRLSGGALLQRFRTSSRKGGWLVQPAVHNHRELADLANGVLATVRVLTCRDEAGRAEATDAVMRFPRGGEEAVDNFHAGGLAAAIDLRRGCLGPATDLGLRPEVGWCDRHPDTDAEIAGRTLPHWEEAKSLALRAHELFPERVFAGWDLALLSDGWYLVEGNAAPDLDILQRTSRKPLGTARFGRLLAHHTAAVLRERCR